DLIIALYTNDKNNHKRRRGGIFYLLNTSCGTSPKNSGQREKFINANPLFFPPMEFKWSNDDYGNGSYQTSVFHDLDGSVDGVPNSYILINDANDAIAIDDSCEIKPAWNAAVCKGDVGRMTVAAPAPAGGRGGRGAGAGPGGGRGGAPAAAGAAPGGRGGAAVAGGPGAGAPGAGRGGAGGGVLVGPRNGTLGAPAPAGPPIVL